MTVACILCSGTDYARDCARGQCAAQQLDLIDGNLLNDPAPGKVQLQPGRHNRGWRK